MDKEIVKLALAYWFGILDYSEIPENLVEQVADYLRTNMGVLKTYHGGGSIPQ